MGAAGIKWFGPDFGADKICFQKTSNHLILIIINLCKYMMLQDYRNASNSGQRKD